MEIERKFLISQFPDLPCENEEVIKTTIYQGYLEHFPGIRIRKKIIQYQTKETVSYQITLKSSGDLIRHEIEFDISKEQFEDLKKHMKGNFIVKDYKRYLLGEHILECSLVDPNFTSSFMYAEIEFKTEEEARKFIPPNFLGKEITKDRTYKMEYYYKKEKL